ncbi:LOW QUALITY PROTEIN: hypothetical protein V1477_002771 [Vespula maculifrons]|uniref:Uncharacterized protein n=1 Tax=Vespula maculifrons TaxID=7453 RepID=A0ABD2CVX7_VESMC
MRETILLLSRMAKDISSCREIVWQAVSVERERNDLVAREKVYIQRREKKDFPQMEFSRFMGKNNGSPMPTKNTEERTFLSRCTSPDTTRVPRPALHLQSCCPLQYRDILTCTLTYSASPFSFFLFEESVLNG